MGWLRRWWSKPREANNEGRQRSNRNEIISDYSKIETQTWVTPRQRQVGWQADSRNQMTDSKAKFNIADSSKVDNRISFRARPNNPETRALVDRVTKTIDDGSDF